LVATNLEDTDLTGCSRVLPERNVSAPDRGRSTSSHR
jgi:hypothetical protein